MRLPLVLAVALLFSAGTAGCVLVFDDDDDPGVCDLPQPEPPTTLARNPETLACEAIYDPSGCDPRCGPCPEYLTPRWGLCDSGCEDLDEATCEETARCRVIKNADCIGAACRTDFVGCVSTSPIMREPVVDCFAARTGDACSESNACTAWHRVVVDQALAPQQERPFALCTPEGVAPGRCTGEVVCDRIPVACPATHVPGIANGCYTGACIPRDLCGPGDGPPPPRP